VESADQLAKIIGAAHPKVPILRSTVAPVAGTYAGPNAFAVSVLEAEGK